MLLTTHDLSDIETLCRRVIVIDHGKLLFDGALSQLRDRILPVTSVVFDVKTTPDPALLVWNGLTIAEVGSHRYRVDIDRRQLSPATAVKEIAQRKETVDPIDTSRLTVVERRWRGRGVRRCNGGGRGRRLSRRRRSGSRRRRPKP